MVGHTVARSSSRAISTSGTATSSPVTTAGGIRPLGRHGSAFGRSEAVPISTAVGTLGMPGMTAYVGLIDIGHPKPGETGVSRRPRARSARWSVSWRDQGLPRGRHRRIGGQVSVRRRRARFRRVRGLPQDGRSRARSQGRVSQRSGCLLRERWRGGVRGDSPVDQQGRAHSALRDHLQRTTRPAIRRVRICVSCSCSAPRSKVSS